MAAGRSGRWWRRFAWIGLILFAALNLIAFLHARAMVTWADPGVATPAPEQLSRLERLRVLATGVSIPRPTNQLTPLAFGLDYETHRIPNGAGDELEAWFLAGGGERAGREEVIALLFHGYAASKDTMLAHALAFQGLGAGALLVDFHGVGGSSGSGTTLGIREGRDVAAALDFARNRWPFAEFVLYGQSMGAAAVLRAVAAEGARPDAIALESSFDRLLNTVGARFHRMGLPAAPFAHVLTFWGGLSIGEDALGHNPVDYAASVTCPALVLQSADDPNISSEQARSIHAALGGWKRYAEYAQTEHGRVLSANSEQWAADLTELLEQLGGYSRD